MTKNNTNISTFINGMSQNPNIQKTIIDYRNIKCVMNLYNCMMMYKNSTKSNSLKIPLIEINGDKYSLIFNKEENDDIVKLVDYLTKYCSTNFTITQTQKTIILTTTTCKKEENK